MISIVEIKNNQFVYPIFKNGRTSIVNYAKENKCRYLFDKQINRVDNIIIFLRDPKERFISGVHSFIEIEKKNNYGELDYDSVLFLIEKHNFLNEHFESQIVWLKKLYKFYKKDVEFYNVSQINDFIPNRDRPAIPDLSDEQKQKIEKIIPDLKKDYALLELFENKRTNLENVINNANLS